MRLRYRDPAPGGDTERRIQRLYQIIKVQLQGFRAFRGGPRIQGLPGEEALAGGLRGCSLPEADRRRRRGYREITDGFFTRRILPGVCRSTRPARRCSRILNTVYIV